VVAVCIVGDWRAGHEFAGAAGGIDVANCRESDVIGSGRLGSNVGV
jgi:hypothetical protein